MIVFYVTSIIYFSNNLVSVPLFCKLFKIVVNNYLDDLSSFTNYSPGALNFYEFLFKQKLVRCIYKSFILF